MSKEDEPEYSLRSASPDVDIYGQVKWPEEWSIEECWEYIQQQKQLRQGEWRGEVTARIDALEYSLAPKVKAMPDYLGTIKRINPDVIFPDTYPDGRKTTVDKGI